MYKSTGPRTVERSALTQSSTKRITVQTGQVFLQYAPAHKHLCPGEYRGAIMAMLAQYGPSANHCLALGALQKHPIASQSQPSIPCGYTILPRLGRESLAVSSLSMCPRDCNRATTLSSSSEGKNCKARLYTKHT
eukprot:scaffold751_cov395-Prasinococcus_capsulatus_cf.AAC.26